MARPSACLPSAPSTSAKSRFFVIGGERLDQQFLSTLDIPTGTRVLLYQNLDAKWNPQLLLDLNGPAAGADRLAPLIEKVRDTGQEEQSRDSLEQRRRRCRDIPCDPALTGPDQHVRISSLTQPGLRTSH